MADSPDPGRIPIVTKAKFVQLESDVSEEEQIKNAALASALAPKPSFLESIFGGAAPAPSPAAAAKVPSL